MEREAVVNSLVGVYKAIGVPADRLPYTDEFEALYLEFVMQIGEQFTRAECWFLLANARKRGLLPRLVR